MISIFQSQSISCFILNRVRYFSVRPNEVYLKPKEYVLVIILFSMLYYFSKKCFIKLAAMK